MKKLYLLTILISGLFIFQANSQPWMQYLTKNKAEEYSLFDYQDAFNKYCDNYKKNNPSKDKSIKYEGHDIPGYTIYKRWEWYWAPRVDQKTGEFPKISAWEEWQEFKTKNNTKSNTGNWTNRGAANLDPIDGGAIQESGTGRLNCALFDPNDNSHFWVGSPGGGLWETTDNASNWTCLTDANPVVGISDIAIPTDYDITTNPTIFIATGDRDAKDDPSIGVLKTTDGGVTWTQTGLDFRDKSNVQIGRLIINPDDKNIMWAATSIGFYKSTDAGDNWTFKQSGNFIDMELVPGSTSTGDGTLIATTYGWSPKAYKTTDGGETWTLTFSASSDEFRCDVAISPANTNKVYIVTSNGNSGNGMAFYGLYISTDIGSSFPVSPDYSGSTNNLYGWGANNSVSSGGQGWYDVTLTVSNTNENVIYIAGVNGFISTNGGSSFTICNAWDSGYGADVIHADHHNAYFRLSDDRLFDCNDGGFYYSDNVTSGGSSNWHSITNGLVTGQLYDVGVSQTVNNEIVSGYQDNGTKLLDPDVSASDWHIVNAGDGMCCAIDPTDINTQWGTYAELRIHRTTDEWANENIIRGKGSADWAAPLEADPINSNTIYIGTDEVERYIGTSNTVLSSGINASYLKALDVYNDGSNLVIWTASLTGCWKSNTSGTGYTSISGLPGDAVTDIAIDEDDYNHVYVCLGGFDNYNVYETTNGGNSWTDISAGLPAVPAGAIVINEQNTSEHEIYVGTDAGIYVKQGNSPWQLYNSGMPFVSITDLEIYYDAGTPANTKIYAATYGRGTWSSDCHTYPTLDASISYISVPADEYCSQQNISPKVQLSNMGITVLTSATISYTIDGGVAVTYNWTGNLTTGNSVDITFPSISLSYGTHDFEASVSNPNGSTDDVTSNNTRSKEYSLWNNNAPYTQSFDNFTIAVGDIGSAVILSECWTNETGESNLDWSVNQGETASAGTGPDGDHTSGTGKYLYTEVSGISSATDAQILSPVFDLTNYINDQVSFWYLMNGANCGSLQIDLYYNGSWHNGISASWNGTTATSISGDKGTSWLQVTADISAADGYSGVQIRISTTTGTAYDGDIAIDDFELTGTVNCTSPTTQASNFSATPNYSSIDLSWTRGNGNAVLVVAREGNAVTTDPSFTIDYVDDPTFGSGDEIGSGDFVVYDGTGTSINVTGLSEGTDYYFAIYEYNTADYCYKTPGLTVNSTTLISPPDITSISPDNFFSDKGKQLTISGSHLDYVNSVTIGGITGTINSQSATSITVTFTANTYSNDILTATNISGNDTYTVTVNNRNFIPVGGGDDYHTTIQDALDGLYAWYGSTSFDAGNFPGHKTIEVYSGTYSETVTPNTNLNPSATNQLIIQNYIGESPVIDATGNTYGVNLGTNNYTVLSGFTVHDADNENIYAQGSNLTISHNKTYNCIGGSGIKVETGSNITINNNLSFDNFEYGIEVNSDNCIVKNNTADNNGASFSPATGVVLFDEKWETGDYTGWEASGGWNIYDDSGVAHSPTHCAEMTNYNAGTLTYSTIDISGYTDIVISCWYKDDANMENQDYIKGEYQIDGGSWVQFFYSSNDVNTYQNPTTAPINTGGTANDLIIRFTAKCGFWEYWVVDDILVEGNEAGSPFSSGAGLFVGTFSSSTVKNNIFVAKSGTDYVALETGSGITVTSNYNTYFKNGNTNLVDYNGSIYANLAAWSGNGAGANEKENNPLFVNSGTDFHIQSTYDSYAGGSWPPDLAIGGAWTTDGSLSPAIDAGDPTDDYPNEPQSGNNINQGAYGNTAQASKSIVTTLTWNGGTNDWQNATNWTPNYVPRSSNNLTIPASLANYPIIDDGSNTAVCFNMDIASGASVTIAPKGQMTVYGDITNNQGVDGLIIQSDATGDASLIINTANVDATVQRFAPTSGSSEWHFISPAVINQVSSYFAMIYAYDESQDDWWTGSNYFYNTASGWVSPPATLNTANGYIVKSELTTFSLTGKLHANSSYSVNVTNGGNTGNAANGDAYITFDGWTLVGNPYSCQLDWEILDKSNDVTSTVYYYDASIQNYAYYQDGGTSLNNGSRYIPMMQGFFVKSNDIVDGGVFTIPNYARTHDNQSFWKAPKQNNLLKLSVTDNNLSDETIIRFVDNIKDDFDTQYDAFKQFAWNNNTPQIFTLNSKRDLKYAINTLNSSDKTRVIPIGYKFATTGLKKIKIAENTLNSIFISVHNNQTGEIFQLLDSNSYSFEITDELNTEKLELILEENTAPYFNTQLADYDGYAGTDFVYKLPTDFYSDDNKLDNIKLNVTLSDGSKLPDWLTFDYNTLAFSGKSDRADNYSIKVEIYDSFGKKSSTNFIMSFKPKSIVYANTKIYPIPAKDLLNIEIAGERTNYHIELVSITGKVLFSKDIKERNSNTISLSNFTNGIYLIKIHFENRDDYIQKITIMK